MWANYVKRTTINDSFKSLIHCGEFVTKATFTKYNDVFDEKEPILTLNKHISTLFSSDDENILINTSSRTIYVNVKNETIGEEFFFKHCTIGDYNVQSQFSMLRIYILQKGQSEINIYKSSSGNSMYLVWQDKNLFRYLRMKILRSKNYIIRKSEASKSEASKSEGMSGVVCTPLPVEDDLNGGSRKKTKSSYKLLEERVIIPGTKRPRRVFIRHGTKYVSSTKSKTGYITLKRVLALAKAK